MEPDNFIAKNRKAYYDYQIMEDFEAGIVLAGTEVKSLRNKGGNISDAYADVRFNEKGAAELWLLNLNIAEYKNANPKMNHEPKRARKLLVHKKEIKKLIGKLEQQGFTLVPLLIYFNRRGLVKLKMGLGKGKSDIDKRESIKKREWNRSKRRELNS